MAVIRKPREMELWVRKQVFREDEGRCQRFVLRHVTTGKSLGQEVDTFFVPKEGADDSWIQDLVSEVEQSAHQDAGGIGGVQSFILYAYFEHGENKPSARYAFKWHAADEEGDEGDDVGSEPPTSQGLLTQLMRHLEATQRTTTMTTAQILTLLTRQLNKQGEIIEKFTEERHGMFDLIENLRSKQLERDLMAREAESKEEMIREGFQTAKLLLPAVINKITGKEIVPQSKTSKDVMLSEFMQSITPEQMSQLSSVLTPAQQIAVVQMMQSEQQEEQAHEQDRIERKNKRKPKAS